MRALFYSIGTTKFGGPAYSYLQEVSFISRDPISIEIFNSALVYKKTFDFDVLNEINFLAETSLLSEIRYLIISA